MVHIIRIGRSPVGSWMFRKGGGIYMDNLTTKDSNDSGKMSLEDCVGRDVNRLGLTDESPIATALLGHFVSYYGVTVEDLKNKIDNKKSFENQYLNNWDSNATR